MVVLSITIARLIGHWLVIWPIVADSFGIGIEVRVIAHGLGAAAGLSHSFLIASWIVVLIYLEILRGYDASTHRCLILLELLIVDHHLSVELLGVWLI